MDDLAAELRLRGLELPYSAVEQELVDRSTQTNEAERKRTVRKVAGKSASSCERITSRSNSRAALANSTRPKLRDGLLYLATRKQHRWFHGGSMGLGSPSSPKQPPYNLLI